MDSWFSNICFTVTHQYFSLNPHYTTLSARGKKKQKKTLNANIKRGINISTGFEQSAELNRERQTAVGWKWCHFIRHPSVSLCAAYSWGGTRPSHMSTSGTDPTCAHTQIYSSAKTHTHTHAELQLIKAQIWPVIISKHTTTYRNVGKWKACGDSMQQCLCRGKIRKPASKWVKIVSWKSKL